MPGRKLKFNEPSKMYSKRIPESRYYELKPIIDKLIDNVIQNNNNVIQNNNNVVQNKFKKTISGLIKFLNEIKTIYFSSPEKFIKYVEILQKHINPNDLSELEEVFNK